MSSEKTYKIGEAAALLKLKSYVLRFWETEFPQLEPRRTDKGQRYYTEEDLELLSRIRYLLHERGLTIEGARRLMSEGTRHGDLQQVVSHPSADLHPTLQNNHFLPGFEPLPHDEVSVLHGDSEPRTSLAPFPSPDLGVLPTSPRTGITATMSNTEAVTGTAREKELEALLQYTLEELKSLREIYKSG